MLFIHWNPDPVAFSLGPLSMRWYGMLWGLTILLGYFLLRKMFLKEKLDDEHVVNMVILFAICGLLGARLGEVIFYQLDYFLQHPSEILKIWQGGLASHGGVAGGFVAIGIICYLYKEVKFWPLIDKIAVIMPLTGGLIRLGNLVNSELIGKPTEVSWAFIFERVDLIPRHPVVLYEAIMLFLVFGLLAWLYFGRNGYKPGVITGLFFSLVFFFRMMLEFFKDLDPYLTIGSTSFCWTQLLSIPVIIMGIVVLVLGTREFFGKKVMFD